MNYLMGRKITSSWVSSRMGFNEENIFSLTVFTPDEMNDPYTEPFFIYYLLIFAFDKQESRQKNKNCVSSLHLANLYV